MASTMKLVLEVELHLRGCLIVVSRHSFCVFVLTSEKDSNTLRVDAYFFENGEKILRFQNYPDRRGSNLVLRFSLLHVAP